MIYKGWKESDKGWLNLIYPVLVALILIVQPQASWAGGDMDFDRITFGGDASYPPFEWQVNGEPRGFNVDLARAISEAGGAEFRYRLGRWPDVIEALQHGALDVVPMFVSDERSRDFLFTSPFHYVMHSTYSRKDAEVVLDVFGLAGRSVAVERQSFAQDHLHKEAIDAQLVLTNGTLQALQAVVAGDADYAVLAAPTADKLIQLHDFPLKRQGPPFWPRGYAFAVHKDRPDLRDWLQRNLELAIATGQYQAVYEKWSEDLQPEQPDTSSLVRIAAFIATIAAVLLALLAVAAVLSWSLQRKVRQRTHDLEEALERAQKAESKARYLADYDVETGLAKPHRFHADVDRMLGTDFARGAGNEELLILKFLDLNEIVGTLGKSYADALVRRFANRIKEALPGAHGYLGRGVFAACSDKANVSEFAERLTAQHQEENDYPYIIIGSAAYPGGGRTSAELALHAELALAIAQSNQKRWVVYDPLMEPDPIDLEIVSRFRAHRLDGLYAVFQPQVDLGTGNIIGAEALVRWQHPVHGQISPAKFIPLIEKAGAVSGLTAMMVDQAARVASELRRRGRGIPISVNVAVQDVVGTNLPGTIKTALARHEGLPQDLKIELTETGFTDDHQRITETLEQLHEMGIEIAIDDFGTGYSTLAYLSRLPISELKIDQIFVRDIATNEKNRGIVRSTIFMARELGLKTMAEGAEDTATLDALTADGCDAVQGYVISKPLSEQDFTALLAGC